MVEKEMKGKSMDSIYKEVATERQRQRRKWSDAHDDRHTTGDFVEYIRNYAGWAWQMWSMGSHAKARRRLIQVAALAIAAVETMDRHDER